MGGTAIAELRGTKMIEKILERLKEEKECSYADFEEYLMKYEIDNEFSSDDDWFYFGLKRAMKIVQEVAKEYDNASDTDLTVVSALPSLYPLQKFEEEAVHKVVASAKDGGWIPCSERLPEDKREVLVWDSNQEMHCVAWYNPSTKIWYSNDFVTEDSKYIVAWCELPAPYQKGE